MNAPQAYVTLAKALDRDDDRKWSPSVKKEDTQVTQWEEDN